MPLVWKHKNVLLIGPVCARCVLTTVCQRSINKARILRKVFQMKYSWSLMMGTSTVFQKNYTWSWVQNTRRALVNVDTLSELLSRMHDTLHSCLALPVPLSERVWDSIIFLWFSCLHTFYLWKHGLDSGDKRWQTKVRSVSWTDQPRNPIHHHHMDCGQHNAFYNTYNKLLEQCYSLRHIESTCWPSTSLFIVWHSFIAFLIAYLWLV